MAITSNSSEEKYSTEINYELITEIGGLIKQLYDSHEINCDLGDDFNNDDFEKVYSEIIDLLNGHPNVGYWHDEKVYHLNSEMITFYYAKYVQRKTGNDLINEIKQNPEDDTLKSLLRKALENYWLSMEEITFTNQDVAAI